MDQLQFSKQIEQFLNSQFPEFVATIQYKEDDSFDCELRSPSNQFSIWIATYDSEITIGIEDPNGKTDIHMHIACNEMSDLEECTKELSAILNDTKNDELVLYDKGFGDFGWEYRSELKGLDYLNGEPLKVYSWN